MLLHVGEQWDSNTNQQGETPLFYLNEGVRIKRGFPVFLLTPPH